MEVARQTLGWWRWPARNEGCWRQPRTKIWEVVGPIEMLVRDGTTDRWTDGGGPTDTRLRKRGGKPKHQIVVLDLCWKWSSAGLGVQVLHVGGVCQRYKMSRNVDRTDFNACLLWVFLVLYPLSLLVVGCCLFLVLQWIVLLFLSRSLSLPPSVSGSGWLSARLTRVLIGFGYGGRGGNGSATASFISLNTIVNKNTVKSSCYL